MPHNSVKQPLRLDEVDTVWTKSSYIAIQTLIYQSVK